MAVLSSDSPVKKISDLVEKILYIVVGALLVLMAAIVIFQSAFAFTHLSFTTFLASETASLLNDVLFAIIILELLSTVTTHLFKGGFQLKSFLIIGIISSVRRILILGASLSASNNLSNRTFSHEIIELGVDALVVLILAIALLITKKKSVSHVSENSD
ncbi:MAG: phosphate-starvation-inducible PsiE family protein [Actinomycetota bacterium]|nr:phosphate-starvation-inducible PsiE family protein [Actinomycetota bacterium]